MTINRISYRIPKQENFFKTILTKTRHSLTISFSFEWYPFRRHCPLGQHRNVPFSSISQSFLLPLLATDSNTLSRLIPRGINPRFPRVNDTLKWKKKKAWIIFPLIKCHVYQLIHPRILQRIHFLDVRSVNRWSYHIRHWKDRIHYRTMKSWSLSRSSGSNFWNEEASFTPTFDPFLSEFLWIPLASWQWLKFHSFRIVRAVSRIPPPLRAPFLLHAL